MVLEHHSLLLHASSCSSSLHVQRIANVKLSLSSKKPTTPRLSLSTYFGQVIWPMHMMPSVPYLIWLMVQGSNPTSNLLKGELRPSTNSH